MKAAIPLFATLVVSCSSPYADQSIQAGPASLHIVPPSYYSTHPPAKPVYIKNKSRQPEKYYNKSDTSYDLDVSEELDKSSKELSKLRKKIDKQQP